MTCPGCGSTATASYCANCGQRQGERVLSVRALFRDVLEDQFSVNSALPRTLRALFFRPGLLTADYLRLRISPYVPPFRLYLVVSVLFFVALAFRAAQPIVFTGEDRSAIAREYAEARDSLQAQRARGEEPLRLTFGVTGDPTSDNWADALEVNLGNERLNRAVEARLMQLRDLPLTQAMSVLAREIVEQIPKAMFLLLPFYALLLKLLYIRSGRYYVEHFIFALHIHAFTFALFLLTLVLPWRDLLIAIASVWLLIYQWLAMKRVYAQGWFRTTLKWWALFFGYTVIVTFVMLVLFTIAIFTATST